MKLSFPKMSRAKTMGAMAGIGLLTASISFGDSLIRFFSSESREEPVSSNVSHVVEHRSGTQSGDLLTGEDAYVIKATDLSKPKGSIDTTHSHAAITHEVCAGESVRIHNSTDEYVEAIVGVKNSGELFSAGIGPGERYLSPPLYVNTEGNGEWIFLDSDNRFYMPITVSDC